MQHQCEQDKHLTGGLRMNYSAKIWACLCDSTAGWRWGGGCQRKTRRDGDVTNGSWWCFCCTHFCFLDSHKEDSSFLKKSLLISFTFFFFILILFSAHNTSYNLFFSNSLHHVCVSLHLHSTEPLKCLCVLPLTWRFWMPHCAVFFQKITIKDSQWGSQSRLNLLNASWCVRPYTKSESVENTHSGKNAQKSFKNTENPFTHL